MKKNIPLNKITIQDRALFYNEAFPQYPDSHFKISDRWISATWITGNNYKGSGYYGSYPPGYIKRVYSMYPNSERILHLFSGSLVGENIKHSIAEVKTLDMNAHLNPDYVANAENFDYGKFDVIFADPPYSKQDAENYGYCLCNKKKVLKQCHKALKSGGHLLWMDQSIPMYSKKNWKWVGVISMYRSTNHRIRGVMIFEKTT